MIGLVVGKPLGIIGFGKAAVRAGWAQVPDGVSWKQLNAVGLLAGIGFTVSIFISSLAFDDPIHLMEAKTAVLAASVIAGVLGYLGLRKRDGASETGACLEISKRNRLRPGKLNKQPSECDKRVTI